MTGRFGAVVTAMATPFRDDDERTLDVDAAGDLARWLVANGYDALVVAGSTGEAATLGDQEKVELWASVKDAVRDTDSPVIAGTGTYDTRHSIELSEQAAEVGADALLLVTPYYTKPPQRGLVAHFTAVARATDLPVLVYNIPGRTATRIEHDTLLELAQVEHVVGVKDATGDLDAIARLVAEAPPGFELYCGDDWATFSAVCLGGVGVISVASHLAGEPLGEMIRFITQGDVTSALKIHQRLMPLFKALFVTSNPIPLKAALEMAGHPVGPPRLPLVPASDQERAAVRKAMEDAGVA